jgi:uncharacterized iron-regulated membrane protein
MNTVVSPLKHRFPSARKIWLNIHLYLGLTAGFALALTGLTGSLLVFKGPILKMEVGDIFDVDGPPPSNANVNEWIANVRRTYSDIKAVNLVVGPGFYLTGGNAAVLVVDFAGNKPSHVTVNPNTGLPLGKFVYDDTYLSFITAFHAHFAVSRPWLPWGLTALACFGVAMIVSMATGLYLWWPRNRNWYAAFTLKRGAVGRRRLLDLHNLFAVYLYVPLLIVALTGVDLTRPDWIDPAVSLLSTARTLDATGLAKTSAPGSCGARTTPGQAVALALARFPSSKFVFINIPQTEDAPYDLQLRPPNNIEPQAQTQVSIDRSCPVILASIDGEVRVAAETSRAALIPLHSKLMLGAGGQVIVFLSGLLLPLSFVTGVLLWLNKRKARPASR